MKLLPAIISNWTLFRSLKCASGTTHTFHFSYTEGNRSCPSPPGNASSRLSAMHVFLRAQGSLLNLEHSIQQPSTEQYFQQTLQHCFSFIYTVVSVVGMGRLGNSCMIFEQVLPCVISRIHCLLISLCAHCRKIYQSFCIYILQIVFRDFSYFYFFSKLKNQIVIVSLLNLCHPHHPFFSSLSCVLCLFSVAH